MLNETQFKNEAAYNNDFTFHSFASLNVFI